jgi:glycosyltransferase involved in cell wall biosynthesis
MKIALLTDGIHPYVIGGMQRHSYYLAKYFAANKIHVDLYHRKPAKDKKNPGEIFTQEEKAFIRLFEVEFPDFGKLPGHYLKESYEFSRRIWAIFQKQSTPDFIYAKGFSGWELLNRKSKGEKLPPIGLNFHGYEMFQHQANLKSRIAASLLLKGPVKFNVKHADFLFSYGGKITGIIKSLGVPGEKIIVIPTGISEDWLSSVEVKVHKPLRFVFVGRYERRKGIEELSAVLKELKQSKKEFEFHFIGPVPEKKKIRSGEITYHGSIDETGKLRSLLQEMDVLVCPSYAEGMPNVILEAMASGLAVIATDTGATSVMVKNEHGWLITPGNKEELRQAMENALTTDPDQLNQMKSNATKFVAENFTWTKVIANTISEIERVTVQSR